MTIDGGSNPSSLAEASPRLFFLHIPKTAGTTLTSFLEQQYPVSEVRPEGPLACTDWLLEETPAELWRSESLPSQEKRAVADLSSHALIAHFHPSYFLAAVLRWFHPDYRVVTTLREPISRVVSHIEHLRNAQTDDSDPLTQEAERLARQLNILELLQHPHPLLQAWLHNFQAKMLAGSQVLAPSDLLVQAKRNLHDIEFVGTTERLQDFMRMLAFSFDWLLPENFPALNTRQASKAAAERVSDEERRAIAEANEIDFDVWQRASARLDLDYTKAMSNAAVRAWSKRRPRAAQKSRFLFTMDEAVPGSGWHERERGAHHAARWIGPVPSATLYFWLDQGRCHRFTVSLISLITPTILDETQIFVNGREVAFDVEGATHYTVVKFTAPAACFTGDAVSRLEFRSLRSYNAKDLYGEDDPRPKTIAVEKIEVEVL